MEYSQQGPYKVQYTSGFRDDLKTLKLTDRRVAARVVALMEQFTDVPSSLEVLTLNHAVYREHEIDFGVREIWKSRNTRPPSNLWRVAILENGTNKDGFRLIYAPHHSERSFYFLGVMPRDVDYDLQSSYFQRVFRDYDDAGIPRV